MAPLLFVHISWTTYERRPMITNTVQRFLRRFVPAEAQRHGATVMAMGVVSDHVHVLIRLPGSFDVPRLVQGLKGASARLLNADLTATPTGLRWAPGYDARSVSPGAISRISAYIVNQAQRHPDRAIDTTP
jgi:REP element-mobilizing transposase RayT